MRVINRYIIRYSLIIGIEWIMQEIEWILTISFIHRRIAIDLIVRTKGRTHSRSRTSRSVMSRKREKKRKRRKGGNKRKKKEK